jgi:uncharacterized protein YndB with AHSA1/START domain
MSSNTRRIRCTPEQVWEVLSDGWLYPLWVVGATRMRAVDGHWPEPGSKLHHSVGVWPLTLNDHTEVLEVEPPSRLVLHAHGWPGGMARVTLTMAATEGGTDVTIEEDVEAGPAKLVPAPVRHLQLGLRNLETLRRLSYIVEGRVAPRPDATEDR